MSANKPSNVQSFFEDKARVQTGLPASIVALFAEVKSCFVQIEKKSWL